MYNNYLFLHVSVVSMAGVVSYVMSVSPARGVDMDHVTTPPGNATVRRTGEELCVTKVRGGGAMCDQGERGRSYV